MDEISKFNTVRDYGSLINMLIKTPHNGKP